MEIKWAWPKHDMKTEKKMITYIMGASLILMALFYAGIAADIQNKEGPKINDTDIPRWDHHNASKHSPVDKNPVH